MTTGMELIEKGKKEGLEQGLEQGAKQARLDDARRMLEEGISADVIARVTGLSREEIEALRD